MADMKMFEKLMEKKGKASLDPEYKSAKMGVLKDLHSKMGDMMGEDVKGLKKVTVAAPSKEGLTKGLDKAEELLSKGSKFGFEDEAPEVSSEGMPCPECGEMHEEGEMPHSLEEVEAKIAELEALKAKLSTKV